MYHRLANSLFKLYIQLPWTPKELNEWKKYSNNEIKYTCVYTKLTVGVFITVNYPKALLLSYGVMFHFNFWHDYLTFQPVRMLQAMCSQIVTAISQLIRLMCVISSLEWECVILYFKLSQFHILNAVNAARRKQTENSKWHNCVFWVKNAKIVNFSMLYFGISI